MLVIEGGLLPRIAAAEKPGMVLWGGLIGWIWYVLAVGGGPIIGSSIIGSSMMGPSIIVPLPHYIRRR